MGDNDTPIYHIVLYPLTTFPRFFAVVLLTRYKLKFGKRKPKPNPPTSAATRKIAKVLAKDNIKNPTPNKPKPSNDIIWKFKNFLN